MENANQTQTAFGRRIPKEVAMQLHHGQHVLAPVGPQGQLVRCRYQSSRSVRTSIGGLRLVTLLTASLGDVGREVICEAADVQLESSDAPELVRHKHGLVWIG